MPSLPNPFARNSSAIESMLAWLKRRLKTGPDPKNGARTFDELQASMGETITRDGLGWEQAFTLFTDVIVPSTRPFNHPTSLSFVAAAPTPASLGFDAVLGVAEIFAGNWDGGSGAIYAENQAIDWLAEQVGYPAGAGGVFVSGGTLGNLSALHAARAAYERKHSARPDRFRILCSTQAHSSIEAVAKVMDAELIQIPADAQGRIDCVQARATLATATGVFAIVGNAGATNCGAVDDFEALADMAQAHDLWLHADGAYGLAAIVSPTQKAAFVGIERSDSFIVDPHKWLFAPYDSCALVYRDAAQGAAAHGQQGAYLDALDHQSWNPSNFALHLTRRPRGLPLWFSLCVYGAEAYAAAVDQTRASAEAIAEGIEATPGLELVLQPQLTVVLFRVTGRDWAFLSAWAEENRRSGALLCLPTTWQGESVLRVCIVNPDTDPDYVLSVFKTLV